MESCVICNRIGFLDTLKVKGNVAIAEGTAIVTFVGGKYPNKSSGNNAAYYVSQDATGINIMDQWSNGPVVK